jgi:PAS domain S-box-containing protein
MKKAMINNVGLRPGRLPSSSHSEPARALRQPPDSKTLVSALKAENEKLRAVLAESRENEHRYAHLFRAIPIPWVVLDASGALLHASRLAEHLLDLKPGAGKGESFTHFIARSDTVRFLAHLRDCKLKRRSAETVVSVHGTNHGPALHLKTSLLPGSKLFYVLLTDMDHAERLNVREKPIHNEVEYDELIDSIDSIEGIVWEADETLRLTRINRKAERLLGFPVELWLKNPGFWRDRIFVDDREPALNTMARAVSSRQDYVFEYRMIASDRRIVWLRDSVKVIRENNRMKLRGIAVDITEQKRAQEELKAAYIQLEQRVRERTAELESTITELKSISYTLSHDMRAPLRAMHGYSELIQEMWGEHLGPKGKDYLRSIQDSSRRLDTLVQDVLKYSKLTATPLELQPVDVERLLKHLFAEYPAFQPPQADIAIEGPMHRVFGHEGFLTQCISNILFNAIKFVPPDTKPRVRIGTRQVGDQVQMWFEDNGIGIAPQDQHRIFRIFTRIHPVSRYEGTGVGLAIVQRAAERMGGQVGVESEPGQGSKFWLQLKKA